LQCVASGVVTVVNLVHVHLVLVLHVNVMLLYNASNSYFKRVRGIRSKTQKAQSDKAFWSRCGDCTYRYS